MYEQIIWIYQWRSLYLQCSIYVNIAIIMNKDMIKESEIINDVVFNLRRLTNLESIEVKPKGPQVGYDYNLIINNVEFACEVKTQVSKANYNLVLQQMRKLKEEVDLPLLLASHYFAPDVFESFSAEGINVVDSSGNCKIEAKQLFINIIGQKSTPIKQPKGKAFNEAGLKAVFYFLLNDTNINQPYRQISNNTGLSLGTITNVVEELLYEKFVIKTSKGRILKNKRALLDTWQVHYNQTLKPKLLLKTMEFVDSDSRKDWELIALPDGVCWGGEGGAYLTNKYLIPEQFDIYTEGPSINLMMTRKMRFEENGSIHVYQKFWRSQHERVAPMILIYADLMGSGNSRCIEAAQKLIENGI